MSYGMIAEKGIVKFKVDNFDETLPSPHARVCKMDLTPKEALHMAEQLVSWANVATKQKMLLIHEQCSKCEGKGEIGIHCDACDHTEIEKCDKCKGKGYIVDERDNKQCQECGTLLPRDSIHFVNDEMAGYTCPRCGFVSYLSRGFERDEDCEMKLCPVCGKKMDMDETGWYCIHCLGSEDDE